MTKSRLAIIGSGSLGSIIGKSIIEELSTHYTLLGILARKKEKTMALANKLGCKAYDTLDQVILDSPDYIIEAASTEVVKDVAIQILENGIHFIPLSVGALADENFYHQVRETASQYHSRVHIPAGAVGGFDVLRSALFMEDSDVQITTTKSPQSLNGAPFLKGRQLSQEKSEDIFRGSAQEAIQAFPQNINVAVATALATTGVNNTQVLIKSIPNLNSNQHKIQLVGDTIKVSVEIQSRPSPDNPKSSTLAAYSVIALLENLVSPIAF